MAGHQTLERIPQHLRQFVVEQDYAAYDEVDQAVWRFVLLQTYNQLKHTAHPIYNDGLRRTGIFIDHIPRIEEMDACLADFGWGAVCVDGFIPPRAFQEFQALGILTIAADIRTADHLAYTPAPDIIHESAGHAPIIPDPDYRHFLQRFGEMGCKAFSSREDQALYEAIRHLSIVKEDLASTPADIKTVERRLDTALAGITFSSESSTLSRLHWWTVEYGLIGKPNDYRIYGAGLLSSVGEANFLHQPKVKKLMLTKDCVTVNYNITEPQPQLFVVEAFDQLNDVLDQVTASFAFRTGGLHGLRQARRSGEVGTVRLNSGLEISGILENYHGDDHPYLTFAGPCALAYEGTTLAGHDTKAHPEGYGSPIGPLDNGQQLSRMRAEDFARMGFQGSPIEITLKFRSGVRVEGRLLTIRYNQQGQPILLSFTACTVRRGDTLLFHPDWGTYDMAVGETIPSVYAGPADETYWPETSYSGKGVPRSKSFDVDHQHLQQLYRSCMRAAATQDPRTMIHVFAGAYEELQQRHPNHWLLAWNMIESLRQCGADDPINEDIRNFMLEIEARYPNDVPVTMGLRYLGVA